jgi:hypothetical protein
MSSWFSSWFKSAEQLKDEAISTQTKFSINEGLWICFLRTDISRDYIRRYLIHYMKSKNFQAISTGPNSICFQQDISNRRCAAVLSVVNGKRRVRYEYYEGDTLDPTSSTSVFFQSILLELASEMADRHMLFDQKYSPLEPIPTSMSSIADENTFMDPKKHFWAAFLRPECAAVARKVILRYCTNSRFNVDEGSDKMVLLLSNRELYLALKIVVGYNSKEELLVHAFYAALPRPPAPKRNDQSDSEDDEDEDHEPVPPPPPVKMIDPESVSDVPLTKEVQEYFHSFLLGMGRQLAQHELLRTQAEEFNKRNALGKPKQQPLSDSLSEEEDDLHVSDSAPVSIPGPVQARSVPQETPGEPQSINLNKSDEYKEISLLDDDDQQPPKDPEPEPAPQPEPEALRELVYQPPPEPAPQPPEPVKEPEPEPAPQPEPEPVLPNKEVYYNPTVDSLFKPLQGPTQPHLPHSLSAPKNCWTGNIEGFYQNPETFNQQYNTYQRYGYALAPGVPIYNPDGSQNFIGDKQRALQNKGLFLNLNTFKIQKKKAQKTKLDFLF